MKPKLPSFKFGNEYFLILLPMFFVLHGYVENIPYVKVKDSILLLLQYFAVILLLGFLFLFLLKSWRKAAVFVFWLMCFHFFFGPFHDQLKQWASHAFITKYTFLLPFFLVLFVILFISFKRKPLQFSRFVRFTNLLFLLLVLLDVGILIYKLSVNTDPKTSKSNINCNDCTKPDIYFIIADEYAGSKQLKDIFNFDNSAFENTLKQRGFHIIDSSVSNYNYTPFSIASTLEMDYLKGIEGRNTSKRDRTICKQIINQSRLTEYLESLGYTFVNHSVFHFENEGPPTGSSLFTLAGKDLITSQTFISRIDRDIRFNTVARFKIKGEMQRFAAGQLEDVQRAFHATKDEAGKSGNQPRFIYTHLMMPHYPYFFSRIGKPYPVETLLEGHQGRKDAYIEYLQYSNKKFIELVDHILKHSKKPPVIILMGDHGFRHLEDLDKKYHFMNLNAIHLPDKNYSLFYNGMSNVNEFRTLLNHLFKQNLPILKDSTSFLQE